MSTISNQKTIFGTFLLKLRFKKRWTLSDLEKETGITASYLNRLENGERKNPTVIVVYALASAYNVELKTMVDLIMLDRQEEKIEE
ncbi:helix-turn-helix transcriptional regulator [Bacillus sp. Cr_A10]|uniref:helix-turn-helix domain-containing protein n=1 Tax=Bacillus sp. Cr_A10 TaxID=3033993 RepID=UPI0023DA7FF1|nr:helix-turn-helix transcriptional regulator [Bacillus sp. Cr_A10]MDF2065096.1 helix-turn-helix transcriptional regulator [Bacillus sp. Cr_A10]